ncbi:tetratricopeptide repeat-containing sensor histidine kinase [Puia dinghuensis]|uniref:tetratricopeptide repeat-containing sensor histidine kinase n=1 Tax=Puia dinghuensis TaxID=1792502 RepID=UPI00166AA9E4|nr:tetratricopeptide repeat-containing sensor histidine kinase [Puia dinghuensis]
MKLLSFLVLLLISQVLTAQVDTNALQRTYYRAAHLSDVDSVKYYADSISHIYPNGGNADANIMFLRLYGWYYENKGDFTNALNFYYRALDSARRHGRIGRQTELMADLAAVYTSDMKQPQKAKEIYKEGVRLNTQLGDAHSLIVSYANLGAIYNNLHLYDSALFFLKEGLRIGKPLEEKGKESLYEIYNNMGNSYYFLKQYDESIRWFRINYNTDLNSQAPDHLANLWLDALNMADSYTQKAAYDSAGKYGGLALQLAKQQDSRSKQSDSYQILAALAQHRGDYKKAWEYQRDWYTLDTALVNAETYKSIAELEQKYEARKKENEKLLLQAALDQQLFHNRIMLIMAIFLLLIAIAAAVLFVTKRNANRQLQATNEHIVRQNERLSELNYEKNSLISIVSHDLSTPFASISMWQQLLQNEQDNLSLSQRKALDRIGQATRYGESLIRHILDVEKAQTNQHKVQLENVDLRIFTENVIDNFEPAAAKKDIQLHLDCPNKAIYFLSDRQLLGRMLENLLSNAIKYTATGKNVWISVSEEKDAISIKIRDEGVGIPPDELPHLFAKYSKISSRPTAGESSTGLGLAIVKRICEELNGQISCESSPGDGSVFTVILKK